ncbi:Adenine phosphoribosyltransferase [Anaerohalosphaera lusitana]|uniref:Adenine phosphoribosyltransferase n=1 Tax=Anaerohalosphaera lusitana TaxID=1936003 RepID=A0A1U9NIY0_9BACT|nr:adenine phosphoribosyltransferase [Anaerohalosphaera lusitana]AQT67698.1 Adenine phosphoribosyltransferase [Anaerohalosphaera lusitana]
MDLKQYIRDIKDFPVQGILFRDITPLLGDKDAMSYAIDAIAEPYKNKNVDYVAAIEARGFIFGAAIAREIGAGFIPIRKPGKLPCRSEAMTYDLEYGSNTIEVHADAVKPGSRVLMFDDLLATGGTMKAACSLMERLGAEIVATAFLVELTDLPGRLMLQKYPIYSVISY